MNRVGQKGLKLNQKDKEEEADLHINEQVCTEGEQKAECYASIR